MKGFWNGTTRAVAVLALLASGCGGEGDSATSPTSTAVPQVVGCNAVSYRGTTWSNLGCAPGIASFSVSISQAGSSACFNITCSAGCVSSARAC